MKAKLLLCAALLGFTVHSQATTHTITVADFSFTPSSIPNVHLGDTIMWVWSNGTHTTTSTSVPSGAGNWNHSMTSTSTSFMYVPTVVGTYQYHCTVHPTMMTGSFVVSSTTGVAQVSNNGAFSIFPNPASSTVKIQLDNSISTASVSVVDISGKVVKQSTVTDSQPLNIEGLPNGLYMLYATQNDNIYRQKLIVAH